MSKKKLCEALGIEISGEGKYILKNINTGEEQKFKTIQEISDKFNICRSVIEYHMGNNITINNKNFLLYVNEF